MSLVDYYLRKAKNDTKETKETLIHFAKELDGCVFYYKEEEVAKIIDAVVHVFRDICFVRKIKFVELYKVHLDKKAAACADSSLSKEETCICYNGKKTKNNLIGICLGSSLDMLITYLTLLQNAETLLVNSTLSRCLKYWIDGNTLESRRPASNDEIFDFVDAFYLADVEKTSYVNTQFMMDIRNKHKNLDNFILKAVDMINDMQFKLSGNESNSSSIPYGEIFLNLDRLLYMRLAGKNPRRFSRLIEFIPWNVQPILNNGEEAMIRSSRLEVVSRYQFYYQSLFHAAGVIANYFNLPFFSFQSTPEYIQFNNNYTELLKGMCSLGLYRSDEHNEKLFTSQFMILMFDNIKANGKVDVTAVHGAFHIYLSLFMEKVFNSLKFVYVNASEQMVASHLPIPRISMMDLFIRINVAADGSRPTFSKRMEEISAIFKERKTVDLGCVTPLVENFITAVCVLPPSQIDATNINLHPKMFGRIRTSLLYALMPIIEKYEKHCPFIRTAMRRTKELAIKEGYPKEAYCPIYPTEDVSAFYVVSALWNLCLELINNRIYIDADDQETVISIRDENVLLEISAHFWTLVNTPTENEHFFGMNYAENDEARAFLFMRKYFQIIECFGCKQCFHGHRCIHFEQLISMDHGSKLDPFVRTKEKTCMMYPLRCTIYNKLFYDAPCRRLGNESFVPTAQDMAIFLPLYMKNCATDDEGSQ